MHTTAELAQQLNAVGLMLLIILIGVPVLFVLLHLVLAVLDARREQQIRADFDRRAQRIMEQRRRLR